MIGNIVALDDRYAALNNRVLEVLARRFGQLARLPGRKDRVDRLHVSLN